MLPLAELFIDFSGNVSRYENILRIPVGNSIQVWNVSICLFKKKGNKIFAYRKEFDYESECKSVKMLYHLRFIKGGIIYTLHTNLRFSEVYIEVGKRECWNKIYVIL